MADWLHGPRPNLISVKPTRTPQFRDINSHYGTAGDRYGLLVEDDEAIRKQMLNVLGTPLGSDDLEPSYGSRFPWRLYEPISPFTTYLLETDTVLALSRWMRGVIQLVIPGAEVIALPEDVGDGYMVSIPYLRVRDRRPGVGSFEVLR